MSQTLSICPKCRSLNNISVDKALGNQAVCGKCGADIILKGLVTEVTGKDLKRIISKSKLPVIVDFWAAWCGPCKMYGPTFQKASVTYKGQAVFLKVNTEAEQQISAEFSIKGIPATIVFKNGKEVQRQAGALPESAIGQLIQAHGE